MGKHTDWWKQAYFKGFCTAIFALVIDLFGIAVMIWRGDGAGGANLIGMVFATFIMIGNAWWLWRLWHGRPSWTDQLLSVDRRRAAGPSKGA